MKNWLDLHMHTSCSADGDRSPEQLVFHCASHGLKAISVTDHNTVRGVAAARAAAKEHELLFISGIEIDCTCAGKNLHVLGYGVDETDPYFAKLEQNIHQQEQEASETLMRRVSALGIPFDWDWVRKNAPDGVVTGELIAESALQTDNAPALLRPYQEGGARADNPYVNFYWDFCAPGKPAYVPLALPSIDEAVDKIHQSGGAAVLAHPGANLGKARDLAETILEHGLDGIEAYSSYHDQSAREFYLALARQRGLLATVGSDYHGKTKPSISVGAAECAGQGQMLYQLMMRIASCQ